LKILQVNTICKSGSTGKIAYDLHTWFQEMGHDSVVAYGRGRKIADTFAYRFSPSWEVFAHVALTRLTGWTGCFSPIATKRLLQFIDRFAPDIVHLHNIHGYYVDAFRLLSFLNSAGIRTVITLHDEWLYTGKCGHAYECLNWLHECMKCPRLRAYPSSLVFDATTLMHNKKKHIFDNFDNLVLVTPSEWLASRVKRSFLADKRITVIQNGIDTCIFYPRDANDLRVKYGNNKAVLYVTADFDDPLKGGRYVVELAKQMPDVSFYVVGNKKAIPRLAKNIFAVGRIENQHELAEWYSFADCSLITSERENFPTVCIESLCCGTPVVGFDVGGTAETAPKKFGAFTPYADMSALISSVRDVFSGMLCSKEACSSFGMQKYAKDVMAVQYMNLYRNIIV